MVVATQILSPSLSSELLNGCHWGWSLPCQRHESVDAQGAEKESTIAKIGLVLALECLPSTFPQATPVESAGDRQYLQAGRTKTMKREPIPHVKMLRRHQGVAVEILPPPRRHQCFPRGVAHLRGHERLLCETVTFPTKDERAKLFQTKSMDLRVS